MVGNKSDLDAQRDVTFEEAKQFAEENGECYHIADMPCFADTLFNNLIIVYAMFCHVKVFMLQHFY